MGDVWRPIYYSRSQRLRWSSVVEREQSSVRRKRPRLLRYYSSEDDDDGDENNEDVVDDGSQGRDDDDGREDERRDESSGGSDANDVVEFSDDDRPVRAVSRARTLVHRGSTTSISPEPESSPPCAPSVVTVENFSAFDCSICYLPLKSPIFQCTVGHVVCSPCNDNLRHATNCHVCRVAIPNGYSRCNVMEQVMDSIRFRCPHAAHGCAERLAYHDRDAHPATCAHKPCHCPADSCSFTGSVQTTLLDHFATVHGWPYTARSITDSSGFEVRLRKGFNVVTATHDEQYTFVLNVEQTAPVCNAITAFCIHPSHTGIVQLGLSYYRRWRPDSTLPSKYIQSSQLDVACTDLSNGMPDPSSRFPFQVPRWSATPGGEDGDDITVTVNYIHRD